MHIGEIVGRDRAAHGAADRRAGERAGLQPHRRLQGRDLAVLGGTHLDRHRRSRGGPRGAEHLLAAHHHLDRAAGLAREDQRQRLEVDDGLAAEAAADLGGDRAHVAQLRSGKLGRHVTDHEVALAAAPDRDLSALDVDDAGVRLDVALMHGLGLEVALDDDVGSGEAGIAVAELVLERAGDVGGGSRSRLGADAAHVLVQDWGTRLQGLVNVDDPGQHLVVDLDQLEGVGRDSVRYRRHRRDRVTHIERLLARHDVAAVEAQVLDAEGGRLVPWELDEVLADHDGLHAGERQGLVGVDGPDAGMGVRAAQDPAPEHAGQGEVGSEGSTSRHLVDAVGPRRPLADPLVVRAVRAIAAVSTHPVALSCELPANRGPASIIALSASRIRRPRRHRIENLPWGTTLKPSLQRSAAYLQWASHACSRESWDAYLARFATR